MEAKNAYGKPQLTVIGKVSDLTLGQSDGDYTDADFPELTPKKDLTFSNLPRAN